MKLHTPIFILGLAVLVTSFLGLTAPLETAAFSFYGIVIMIISSTIKPKTEIETEGDDAESLFDTDINIHADQDDSNDSIDTDSQAEAETDEEPEDESEETINNERFTDEEETKQE